MLDAKSLQDQAETFSAQARAFEQEGRAEEALTALQNAVLHYAAADAARESSDTQPLAQPPNAEIATQDSVTSTIAASPNALPPAAASVGITPDPHTETSHGSRTTDHEPRGTSREPRPTPGPLTLPRADACRLYGDALAAAGRYAEAAGIFQEATDQYGLLEDAGAQSLAKECAHRVMENLAAVRAQPQERLHLLIAHYERAQQQLALEPGTEGQQAQCRMHIARIYQRRDRPADSATSYRAALDLLAASDAPANALARAECHHRLAVLLANALGEPSEAIPHYRSAIALYQAHEPFVYGFQQSLELCRAELDRIETLVSNQNNGRKREWSRD